MVGTEQDFNKSEPGLSHPRLPLSIRLMDDGRIAIQAGDYAGIILNSETGVVTIYGSAINFATDDMKIEGEPIDIRAITDASINTFTEEIFGGKTRRRLLEQDDE